MKYAGYDCNPRPMPSEDSMGKLMDMMIKQAEKSQQSTGMICTAEVLLALARHYGAHGTDDDILARYADCRDAGWAYHLGDI